MKKIFLLVITTLLAINIACAQDAWVNYKIDDKLSVKIPDQPTKLDEHSVFFRDKDTSIYIIAIVDVIKTEGIDSAKMIAEEPTAEYANNLKGGMLGQMPGFTMGDVNISKWKGYTCYTFDGGNTSQKLKIYTFVVFIGRNLYSLITILPENKSPGRKDIFFDSLVLN